MTGMCDCLAGEATQPEKPQALEPATNPLFTALAEASESELGNKRYQDLALQRPDLGTASGSQELPEQNEGGTAGSVAAAMIKTGMEEPLPEWPSQEHAARASSKLLPIPQNLSFMRAGTMKKS